MAIGLNEVTQGTFHRHYAMLLDGIDPNTDVTAVDLKNEVKKGATSALLHVDARSTGGIYDVPFYDDSGAGASSQWAHAETHSGNADWHGQMRVGLDAARKFYYQAGHANVDELTVKLLGYWV